ncbi:hypothetical protein DAPPUDRAFT_268862 [Daphnia pulex]|uniref:Endonuclease/exonuclease/phosphatase domain-containing protein n=1 Tax=Daphnia pulex TaxID=6669 RepID=E9HYG6_DAPPU|nr:hypothetical protein DAPPUDRAFT_268862 [Daphnia pulex]|eukprot:EFX63214.1 hypothetical protein DAPPUDRAFT_268862 [Daphnia pulex]
MHFANFAACVELSTNSGPIRISSIYLRPSIPDFSAAVTLIFEAVSSPFVIIGTDANAKSQLWNSSSCDKRGSEFESILANFKLNVINRPSTDLDFIPSGTSFVDLTLAGDKVRFHRWFYLATPSLYDHPYVFFEIDHAEFEKPQRKPFCRSKPKLSWVNRDLFTLKLKKCSILLANPYSSGLLCVSGGLDFQSCFRDFIERECRQNLSTPLQWQEEYAVVVY